MAGVGARDGGFGDGKFERHCREKWRVEPQMIQIRDVRILER